MDSTGIYGHEKTADRTVCRFLCPKIIKCTLREHSIIMNKRKLWGCPKTSLLILNEYLTEQTCKQSVVVLRIHDAKPDVLVVQKWKGGAVADHHFLANCAVKEIL